MLKLLRYLKKYTVQCIVAPLFKLLEVCFELMVPLIVSAIIDIGISAGNTDYIVKMVMILVLFAVTGLSCTLVAQFFSAKAAVGFGCDLRAKLFEKIQSLSYSQLDKIGTSTLITRLTGDINQVTTGVNLTLRLLLRSPFVVFGAMIMAFSVDPKTALIFTVVIPVLAVIIFVIIFLTIPLYRKAQTSLDGVVAKTDENLRGVRVVRAFCKQEEDIAEFAQKNQLLYRTQIFVGKISAVLNPATVIIINLAIVGLIYAGAIRVETGILTTGQVVALYNYMTQILVELIKFANLVITVSKAVACGNRIENILEIEPDLVSGNVTEITPCDTAVEFSCVSLNYDDGEPALSDITLQIKKGETVGIIGATGAGKTSLVNLIPRFYEATKGEVKVFGRNVKEYNIDTLRSVIGIVPQSNALFKGSLRENMKIAKADASDCEILSALKAAQIEDFVSAREEGLDFMIEQGGKNLSGGQRQRMNIARTLLKAPEILILDDSSSALDYATDAKLRASIKNLDFGGAVIIVSQRASAIMNADKIIVLEDGKIVAVGTDETLKETCEIYREIRDTQFYKEGGSL